MYSGGGVEPDKRFDGPIEGFNPSRFARTLYGRNLFDTYAQRFARSGDTSIPPSPNTHVVAANFEVTDAMVAEFKEMAMKEPVKWDEASWQKDQDFIKAMIRREIDVDRVWRRLGVLESREARPAAAVRVDAVRRGAAAARDKPSIDDGAPGFAIRNPKAQIPSPDSQATSRWELGVGSWFGIWDFRSNTIPPFWAPTQNIVVLLWPCH